METSPGQYVITLPIFHDETGNDLADEYQQQLPARVNFALPIPR
jgi:hypothetical protein